MNNEVIGTVAFFGTKEIEYTNATEYVKAVQAELPYRASSGFKFTILTDDPRVHGAVNDLVLNEYGENHQRRYEQYTNPQTNDEKPKIKNIGEWERSNFVECINGELKVNDIVISTNDADYTCLVGKVIQIDKLGTLEHTTGNAADDVHVNFQAFTYSTARQDKITESLSVLHGLDGKYKSFDDFALDDVIMAPESLIQITDITQAKLNWLLDSTNYAAAFVNYAKQMPVPITTSELRTRLQEIEDKDKVFNGMPLTDINTFGTQWVDTESSFVAEYETDKANLSVRNLSDRDLQNVRLYEKDDATGVWIETQRCIPANTDTDKKSLADRITAAKAEAARRNSEVSEKASSRVATKDPQR
jgi:hypothetical protein